jgi:serine/threonine protein kinase
MGEVYRSTDTKLGRECSAQSVARRDGGRSGATRALSPRGQGPRPTRPSQYRPIYSAEECDSIHFLTMQLVEGQPLDRLICTGGLPLEQIVEVASALGDALAVAHEKVIVHRDLKPTNVVVSNDGRVKVLDFGLANDLRATHPVDATMRMRHPRSRRSHNLRIH